MFVDILDGLSNGLDFFGLIVGNAHVKFIFEFHDQLDGIETVGIKVVYERGFPFDFRFIDT